MEYCPAFDRLDTIHNLMQDIRTVDEDEFQDIQGYMGRRLDHLTHQHMSNSRKSLNNWTIMHPHGKNVFQWLRKDPEAPRLPRQAQLPDGREITLPIDMMAHRAAQWSRIWRRDAYRQPQLLAMLRSLRTLAMRTPPPAYWDCTPLTITNALAAIKETLVGGSTLRRLRSSNGSRRKVFYS